MKRLAIDRASSNGAIEIVRRDYPRGPFRAAVIDFDGTLSLLRGNWQEVMTEMMLEALAPLSSADDREALMATIDDIVAGMAGRPTIDQMTALAGEVHRRGGADCDPQAHLQRFSSRLGVMLQERIEAITSGRSSVQEHTVHGSGELLAALQACEVHLCLASGTELRHVQRELALLGLVEYFGEWVYGPTSDGPAFSKRAVVERLLEERGLRGEELFGLGDGPVEIEEIKRVGGLAVGVACDETTRQGIDPRKRRRLIDAGADLIIADYRCLDDLLPLLALEKGPPC